MSGAPIDQGSGHLDIVATSCPMQRCLSVPAPLHGDARVSAPVDKDRDDLWSVGEVSRPIRRSVQSPGARASLVVDQTSCGETLIPVIKSFTRSTSPAWMASTSV